jgi:hypothetical protein
MRSHGFLCWPTRLLRSSPTCEMGDDELDRRASILEVVMRVAAAANSSPNC